MLRLDPLTAYARWPRNTHAIGVMIQEEIVELRLEVPWVDATNARGAVTIIVTTRRPGTGLPQSKQRWLQGVRAYCRETKQAANWHVMPRSVSVLPFQTTTGPHSSR